MSSPFIRARVDGEIVLYDLPAKSLERIRLKLSLRNPEFVQLKRFVGFVGTTPERLHSAVEMPDGSLHCPRGTWQFLREELTKDGLIPRVEDDARAPGFPIERKPVSLTFDPRDYQRDGVRAFLKHTQGLIVLPCGTGKSKLGLSTILDQPVSTLITVPTIDIARQWLEDARAFGFDPGLVGDGKDEGQRGIVVATDDSAALKIDREPEWAKRFGRLIADEVHHAAAKTFYATLRQIPARQRLGLTATLDREDGLTDFVRWAFGDVLLERTTKEMIAKGYLLPCTVECIPTDFTFVCDIPDGPKRLAALEQALADDMARNALIAERVAKGAQEGKTILTIARSRDHVHELAACIAAQGGDVLALTGKTAKKKREKALTDFREGRLRAIVATSLADEGLDIQRLTVIALACASRARATTTQRLGRTLRLWKGKKPELWDFVDEKVPTLANRARERWRVYQEAGIV